MSLFIHQDAHHHLNMYDLSQFAKHSHKFSCLSLTVSLEGRKGRGEKNQGPKIHWVAQGHILSKWQRTGVWTPSLEFLLEYSAAWVKSDTKYSGTGLALYFPGSEVFPLPFHPLRTASYLFSHFSFIPFIEQINKYVLRTVIDGQTPFFLQGPPLPHMCCAYWMGIDLLTQQKLFVVGTFILFFQYNSEHLLSVMLYEVPMRTVQWAYWHPRMKNYWSFWKTVTNGNQPDFHAT